MRNLNIGFNTNCTRLNDMFSDGKKLRKYIFGIIRMLKFRNIASFLRTMTWYIFILILLHPLAIKTTNSGKNSDVYIDKRIIKIIFHDYIFINYPENIFLLYEYNIICGELDEKLKTDIFFYIVDYFQYLIDILNRCSRTSKRSNTKKEAYKIKNLFHKFCRSVSSLELISLGISNTFKNEFSTPILFTSDPIQLKKYSPILEKINSKILSKIINFKTEYEKNEEYQEIYMDWIKPFCEFFEMINFKNINSPLSENFAFFFYEFLQVMRKIFNSYKKILLFKNKFEEFQTVRISSLIEDIKERKTYFQKTVLINQKRNFIVNYYQFMFKEMLNKNLKFLYESGENRNQKYEKIIKFLTSFFQKYINKLNEVNQYFNDNHNQVQKYEGKITSIKELINNVTNEISLEYVKSSKNTNNFDLEMRKIYKYFLYKINLDETKYTNFYYNYLANLYILNLYLLKTTGCTEDVSSLFNDIQPKIAFEILNFFKKKYNYVEKL